MSLEEQVNLIIGKAVREPDFAEALAKAKTGAEFAQVLFDAHFGTVTEDQEEMIKQNLPTLRDAADTLDMSKIRYIS